MAETFESLLQDVNFMKSVFAAMESVRHESYLSSDDKFRLQRSQVDAIYGSHGITLTDDQYYSLVDYCKDAEETVSELSDDEASLLAAGLDSLNNLKKSDLTGAADQLRETANQLDDMAAGNMNSLV